MPRPGMRWRHVVISTWKSWLPGNPRGFRSRHHKIHSSGDYKDPPPEGEHAGLYRFHSKNCGDPIVLPPELRETVGKAIRRKLKEMNCQVLAIAVAATHVHLLVELPEE